MPDRAPLVLELAELLQQSLKLVPPTPSLAADEPLFGGRLGLDSVDSLQWAVAVEQNFQIELSDRDIASGAMESLGHMADMLLGRGIRARSRAEAEPPPQDEIAH